MASEVAVRMLQRWARRACAPIGGPPRPGRCLAEDAVARHLAARGWTILGRNVRVGPDRAGHRRPRTVGACASSSWRCDRARRQASAAPQESVDAGKVARLYAAGWRYLAQRGSYPVASRLVAQRRLRVDLVDRRHARAPAPVARRGPPARPAAALSCTACRWPRVQAVDHTLRDPRADRARLPPAHNGSERSRAVHHTRVPLPAGVPRDHLVAGLRITRLAEAEPNRRSTPHAVHLDAPAAGSRCPLRAPDSPLESQDEALHLRGAQRHPHHRPGADGPAAWRRPSTSSPRRSPTATTCSSWAPRSRPRSPSPRRLRVPRCPMSTTAGWAACSPTS